MSEGCQPASDHATSNSSPHRRQDMRRGRPASDCRSRQLGQTAYRSLQPSGRRTASLGRGTTLHLRGGRSMTCRNADGISSRRPPTSRTARSGSSRVMRYHAPRRSFRFKSACKRAHIPVMASPRCVAHLMFPKETPGVKPPDGPLTLRAQPSVASPRLTWWKTGGRRPTTLRPGCGRTMVDSLRTGGGSVVFSLLEFRRKSRSQGWLRVGLTSLVIHTAMIGGVVYATLHAAPSDTRVSIDTTVLLLAPQQQQKPLDPPPVQLADALKGFQTVAVPTQIPTDIPPVDLLQRFDPKDYSRSGIEGGRGNGIVVSGSEVYAEALVEERPELLSAPPPIYPQLLKQAGIQGRVILHAIVDTTGRVEPASVRIIKSPSPAFDQPTKDWVLKALFRPARLHGRCVRVFINLPVDYSLTGSPGSP